MSNDALDFLMGGAPTASFLEIGTVHKGRIRSYEKTQQRDMDTGQPKVYEDGSPAWQIVFTLETDERDPELDSDDGLRRVFAKGAMLGAIRAAIRKSGHRGEIRGGMLAVKYDANDIPTRKGFNPPKMFKAKFEAPSAADEFDGDEFRDEEAVPQSPEDEFLDGTEPF